MGVVKERGEDRGQRGIKRRMVGKKKKKKKIYRDMYEVSSPSGKEQYCHGTEQMEWATIEDERKEVRKGRGEKTERKTGGAEWRYSEVREREEGKGEHYCVRSLLGFSYFPAHHHSPGT